MKDILADLKILLLKTEISAKEFNDFLKGLKSNEVKNYIEALSKGSKAEQALREAFFTNNSKFAQFLFINVFPEVSQEGGFLDYLIKAEREEISLEIKPLYDGIFTKEKTGKIFSKIKKVNLNPEAHKEQILKYLRGTREFVVLTNLEEWYLYSKSYSLDKECNHFGHIKLFDLLKDFSQVEDFWQYIDKQEDLFVKKPLDTKFFLSLKEWVSELSKIELEVEENKKTELIINLINKFIFIQSLDKFWVIDKNYIAEEWSRIERRWAAKNKSRILQKFLNEIDEYFYELYDTELFRAHEDDKTILDYITQTPENVELFYQKFKVILGIEYGTAAESWIPGITQYNFRRIDEDILGKSYETFLAEIRKESGIYYTPKYITQYIVENTVGKVFDNMISKLTDNLDAKNYESSLELLSQIISIKVLDPACGSGSFLIKALRVIWNKYIVISRFIEKHYQMYSDFKGKVVRTKEVEEEFQKVLELKNLLNFENQRELISKLVIRHLYGNDLDSNALEVAKLNLWLEAIKLAPSEFQYNKLPSESRHILPDLEINLSHGDSLVELPEQQIITYLYENHRDEIKKLFQLRFEYLKDTSKLELIKEINQIKTQIKDELIKIFKKYLTDNDISLDLLDNTIPLFWPLEFWFIYFNKDSKLIDESERGFDAIIGNPPYFTIRGKGTGTLVQISDYEFLQKDIIWNRYFRSQSDIYYYFIIKSINLLKGLGKFGFIIEDYWLENEYADRLKEEILKKTALEILIKFGKVKKIFEDADNNTCILIFERNKNETQEIKYIYCKKNFSEATQQLSNQKLISHIIDNIKLEDFSDEYIDIFWVEQNQLGTSKWMLSRLNKLEIIKKIEQDKKKLGDICDVGQGQVPGRKKEFRIVSDENSKDGCGYWINIEEDSIEVIDKRTKNTHRLEKDFLKPLITNSGIKKYFLIESDDYLIYTVPLQEGRFDVNDYPGISGYLEVYEDKLKERYDYDGDKYPWYGYQHIQNTELFEDFNVKIICPYRTNENSFALDTKGYFGTTDMYAIVPKEDSISINYLLGILNSKVLTFWYKIAGKSKGLMLEFFAIPISKMPIYEAIEEEQAKINDNVSNLILLKQVRQKFREIWKKYSQKYRNGILILKKLILNDKINIQKGEFEKIWISDVNIFPDSEDEIIDKQFLEFEIIVENENNLKIYGIDNSDEILLLDLKTKKKEFRDIIYLEILRLLDSSRKVNNLKDIFLKTEISIIKPNIWEKSCNLIKFTNEKFKEWLSEQNIKIEIKDIVKIENDIESLENMVDAIIFKYYGLTLNEIEVIFSTLSVKDRIKNDILKKLSDINKGG